MHGGCCRRTVVLLLLLLHVLLNIEALLNTLLLNIRILVHLALANALRRRLALSSGVVAILGRVVGVLRGGSLRGPAAVEARRLVLYLDQRLFDRLHLVDKRLRDESTCRDRHEYMIRGKGLENLESPRMIRRIYVVYGCEPGVWGW